MDIIDQNRNKCLPYILMLIICYSPFMYMLQFNMNKSNENATVNLITVTWLVISYPSDLFTPLHSIHNNNILRH